MVPLYTELSSVYDDLFPVSEAQRALFDRLLGEGWIGRVADAGCGSGAQLLHFAAAGVPCIGFDPDPALAALARRKLSSFPSARIEIGGFADMARIVDRPVDLVLCLGNSLVHVPGTEAARFLRDAAALTSPRGGILLQILNYERLHRKGITELPAMEATGGEVSFRRVYVWEGARKVRFMTELAVRRGGAAETARNEISLYPLYPDEVREMLIGAGFPRTARFGDFTGSDFGPDSEALVCLARKG